MTSISLLTQTLKQGTTNRTMDKQAVIRQFYGRVT